MIAASQPRPIEGGSFAGSLSTAARRSNRSPMNTISPTIAAPASMAGSFSAHSLHRFSGPQIAALIQLYKGGFVAGCMIMSYGSAHRPLRTMSAVYAIVFDWSLS
jgi:hypothetical protein